MNVIFLYLPSSDLQQKIASEVVKAIGPALWPTTTIMDLPRTTTLPSYPNSGAKPSCLPNSTFCCGAGMMYRGTGF